MKELKVMSTYWADTAPCPHWNCEYEVSSSSNVHVIIINTVWSWLEVLVARYDDGECAYYVAVLDGHTAACRLDNLDDCDQITAQLLIAGLNPMEAVTVTQVLSAIKEEELSTME